MDPQTTAGLVRGFSQEKPSPHARLETRKGLRYELAGSHHTTPLHHHHDHPLFAHNLRLGQVLPDQTGGCPALLSQRRCVSRAASPALRRCRGRLGGTDAGTGVLHFTSPRPSGEGQRGDQKAASEGEEGPLMHDLARVPLSRVHPQVF